MPAGWKKNIKSNISKHEKCGGSRHHKKAHGNSNKRTCACCSCNGNDKSLLKQKGWVKREGKCSQLHDYEEYDDMSMEPYCSTWTTCDGQSQFCTKSSLELYDKVLSDYIVDKLQHPETETASATSEEFRNSDTTESDVDDDWEIVTVDSAM